MRCCTRHSWPLHNLEQRLGWENIKSQFRKMKAKQPLTKNSGNGSLFNEKEREHTLASCLVKCKGIPLEGWIYARYRRPCGVHAHAAWAAGAAACAVRSQGCIVGQVVAAGGVELFLLVLALADGLATGYKTSQRSSVAKNLRCTARGQSWVVDQPLQSTARG